MDYFGAFIFGAFLSGFIVSKAMPNKNDFLVDHSTTPYCITRYFGAEEIKKCYLAKEVQCETEKCEVMK